MGILASYADLSLDCLANKTLEIDEEEDGILSGLLSRKVTLPEQVDGPSVGQVVSRVDLQAMH